MPRGGREREVQQSLFSLKQAKDLLTFARSGGKAAAWSLLGTALGLTIALVGNVPQAATMGTIGSMVGLGAYGLRLFQRFRTTKYEDLDDERRDLEVLRLTSRLNESEYDLARAKVLRKFGVV